MFIHLYLFSRSWGLSYIRAFAKVVYCLMLKWNVEVLTQVIMFQSNMKYYTVVWRRGDTVVLVSNFSSL